MGTSPMRRMPSPVSSKVEQIKPVPKPERPCWLYCYNKTHLSVYLSHCSCLNKGTNWPPLLLPLIKQFRMSEKINVWFDASKTTGDYQQRLAEGIGACEVLLIFLTEQYCSCQNCLEDVKLAIDRQKIVAILQNDPDCIPEGELQSILEDAVPHSNLLRPSDSIGFQRLTQQLYELAQRSPQLQQNSKMKDSDSSVDASNEQIRLIGVPHFSRSNYIPRPAVEDGLTNCIKEMSADAKQDFFVVHGRAGVGKTTLVSNILRENLEFLQSECNAGVIIWISCSKWRNTGLLNVKPFYKELLALCQKAMPNVNTLKEVFDNSLKVFIVLDGVFNFEIPLRFVSEHPSTFCCVICERFPSEMTNRKFEIPNFREDELLSFFELQDLDLSPEQLRNLTKYSFGMPLLATQIRGYFLNWRDHEKGYQILFDELQTISDDEMSIGHLLRISINSMLLEDRQRLLNFLLFASNEEVEEEYLRRLWNCGDIEEVRFLCQVFKQMGILTRSVNGSCIVHEVLHRQLLEVAVEGYGIRRVAPNWVSELRVRLLIDNATNQGEGNASNMFACLYRLSVDQLAKVLGNIDNEAFKFLEGVGKTFNESEDIFLTAASLGHENLVRYYIRMGIYVEACDEDGRTALIIAAEEGHEGIVEVCLEDGKVNVEANDVFGRTALMLAAEKGHEKCVELLITKGKANVEATVDLFDNGETALFLATCQGHEKVVEMLLNRGMVSVDIKGRSGRTCLMMAAKEGHLKVVDLLLEYGRSDVEAIDDDGITALMLAAKHGHEKVVELLLSKGKANAEVTDRLGQTALMIATENGNSNVCQVLISLGNANVESAKFPLLVS